MGLADEGAVRKYRDCLANYGAIIGQAYLYLTEDLDSIRGSVRKDRSGHIDVRGMGYDDFVSLAQGALQRAIKNIQNPTIRNMEVRATTDGGPCRFDRETTNIKCGPDLMIIGTKPQLFVSGIEFYGEKFAGYAGT
ncbi:MAG: hypothetical protein M0Z48_04955 [Nitrospiraceae bacterium]|nr:hypothetical protein [Nitrospiraceae bacterium]